MSKTKNITIYSTIPAEIADKLQTLADRDLIFCNVSKQVCKIIIDHLKKMEEDQNNE